MTREEFERKFDILGLGTSFERHKKLRALVFAYVDELEAKIPKWRSVEDEQPVRGCYFYTLIIADERIIPAKWSGRRMVELVGGRDNTDYTHWLPLLELLETLPEKPEQEN